MDYLNNRITRKEFISTRGAVKTQLGATTSLNLFDYFCKQMYQKEGDQVTLDIENAIKLDGEYDRLFRLCNSFVKWLEKDHPEIKVRRNHYYSSIKKHTPSTIKRTIHDLRQYFEEFGHIEFSERKFRRMVRTPKRIEEDLEPFKKEEIREFIDNAMPIRKALYMTQKDSGMRIGEVVQIKKRDVDFTTNPVTITIPAAYTKTKKGRTTFVTRETRPLLKKIADTKQDDEQLFGVNGNCIKSVVNEESCFRHLREKLGYTERYESNGRHKKNLHSLRAFCATQLAEVHGEEFGHGFIGHKGYLSQYIRNKEKLAEKYLRAENHLMIYETIEVVDQDERVQKLEEQQKESKKDMEKLTNILSQISDIKVENVKKDMEIQKLKILLEQKLR